MTQPTPPQYRSSNSVAKRPTLFIDVNDPRAKRGKLGMIQSRSGSEIQIVNTAAGMSMSALYSNLGVASGAIGAIEDQKAPASFDQVAASLTPNSFGNIEVISNPNAPLAVTNLSASWSGANLVVTFNFDTTDPANQYFKDFVIGLTPNGGTAKYVYVTADTTSTNQTYNFTLSANSTLFGFLQTNFSSLSVVSEDAFLNQSLPVTIVPPIWSNGLPTPYITANNITNGYQITTTYLNTNNNPVFPAALPVNPNLNYVDIEEYVDTAGAINVLGQDITNLPSTLFTGKTFTQISLSSVNPVTIYSATTDPRYIRAKFTDVMGSGTGSYSNIAQAIPAPVAVVNTKAPTDVTAVSATFATGTTPNVSGDDIIVTATIPTDGNAGNSFIVKLVPKTAPTLSGSFYFYPSLITTPQQFLIDSTDIFSQFGTYYSDYKGYVISVSAVGNKSAGTGTAIPEFVRTDALGAITPVAIISNVIDGYTAQFNLSSSGASYAEVYQFFTNPTWVTSSYDPPDYFDATAVSSTTNTITVNSLSLENNGLPVPSGTLPYVGYLITGASIPVNTYITGITGTGPTYTLTLSNNLTDTASGNYHMQALVYSGVGPANVFLNYYTTVYLIVAYYDNYGNRSLNSAIKQASPVNPATSLIQNAIQVGSGGAIYIGSSSTTGARIVLGPSQKAADGSQYSGVFAFDGAATAGSAATTSIISNPAAGGYTFETVNAKIADWSIDATHIQNTLGTSSNYVGLSATGPYSFWAGSQTSGGDASAAFTVTPTGVVTARKMQLIGDGTSSTNLISAGTFSITNAGVLNATGANISGTITASGGSFTGNVQLNGGSLYAGSSPSSGARIVINSNGLSAYDAGNGAQTTSINTNAASGAPTFTTTNALIGNWSVGLTTIKSQNKAITLDAANDKIVISGPIVSGVNQDTYELVLSTAGSVTNVIQAGTTGQIPNFAVTGAGILSANNAVISGTISAKGANYAMTLDPNNQYLSFGTPTVINGLMYTRGSAIVMHPGSTPAYTSGTIISETPSLVMDKTTNTVTLGVANIVTNVYGLDGKIYSPPTNQYVSFGPNGLQITSPSYIGDLTTVLDGTLNGNKFIRMIAYNPYNGGLMGTGPAIYYEDSITPSNGSSGLVGDIWLVY